MAILFTFYLHYYKSLKTKCDLLSSTMCLLVQDNVVRSYRGHKKNYVC